MNSVGKEYRLTIGRLATAAGVGVETIRYYQNRKLVPVPARSGAYRHYPLATVDRLRFIKRAQELGFTLAEVGELLKLNDGSNRRSIRAVASARLEQIESKLADLQRMRRALKHLVHECEHADNKPSCPIIDAIATGNKAGQTSGTSN